MMRWIPFFALFSTWCYAIWQDPPAGYANVPFYLGILGTALTLWLEDNPTEPEPWPPD